MQWSQYCMHMRLIITEMKNQNVHHVVVVARVGLPVLMTPSYLFKENKKFYGVKTLAITSQVGFDYCVIYNTRNVSKSCKKNSLFNA